MSVDKLVNDHHTRHEMLMMQHAQDMCGSMIQYTVGDERGWIDCTAGALWYTSLEYRIKPEEAKTMREYNNEHHSDELMDRMRKLELLNGNRVQYWNHIYRAWRPVCVGAGWNRTDKYRVVLFDGTIVGGDDMGKQMTKDDLVDGMIVEYRDGDLRLVLSGRLFGEDGGMGVDTLENDLTYSCGGGDHDLDVVKVYKHNGNGYCLEHILDKRSRLELIWEREVVIEVKEVTLADLEAKYGCVVKVVK